MSDISRNLSLSNNNQIQSRSIIKKQNDEKSQSNSKDHYEEEKVQPSFIEYRASLGIDVNINKEKINKITQKLIDENKIPKNNKQYFVDFFTKIANKYGVNGLQKLADANLLDFDIYKKPRSIEFSNGSDFAEMLDFNYFDETFNYLLNNKEINDISAFKPIFHILPRMLDTGKDLNTQDINSKSFEEKQSFFNLVNIMLHSDCSPAFNNENKELLNLFPFLSSSYNDILTKLEDSFWHCKDDEKFTLQQNGKLANIIQDDNILNTICELFPQYKVDKTINNLINNQNFKLLNDNDKFITLMSIVLYNLSNGDKNELSYNKDENYFKNILAKTNLPQKQKEVIVSIATYLKDNDKIYDLIRIKNEDKESDLISLAQIGAQALNLNIDPLQQEMKCAMALNYLENMISKNLTQLCSTSVLKRNQNDEMLSEFIEVEKIGDKSLYSLDLTKLDKKDEETQAKVLEKLGMGKKTISDLSFLIHVPSFDKKEIGTSLDTKKDIILSCSYLYASNMRTFGQDPAFVFVPDNSMVIYEALTGDGVTPLKKDTKNSFNTSLKGINEDNSVISKNDIEENKYDNDSYYPTSSSIVVENSNQNMINSFKNYYNLKMYEKLYLLFENNESESIKKDELNKMVQQFDDEFVQNLEKDFNKEQAEFFMSLLPLKMSFNKKNYDFQAIQDKFEDLIDLDFSQMSSSFDIKNELESAKDTISSFKQIDYDIAKDIKEYGMVKGNLINQKIHIAEKDKTKDDLNSKMDSLYNRMKRQFRDQQDISEYNEILAGGLKPGAMIIHVDENGNYVNEYGNISDEKLEKVKNYLLKHNLPLIKIPISKFKNETKVVEEVKKQEKPKSSNLSETSKSKFPLLPPARKPIVKPPAMCKPIIKPPPMRKPIIPPQNGNK